MNVSKIEVRSRKSDARIAKSQNLIAKIRRSSLVIRHFLILIILFSFNSCVRYNFTGGGTGCAKTISIQNFFNDAGGGPPNLGQQFTEKLRDYYLQNSKISLVNTVGDWQFDGRIIGWSVLPIAPKENETAALNRLTITINVNFINSKETICENEVKSFESKFSFYDDFSQDQSLSQVEAELVNSILDRIVFDIYTKTTSNW